MMVFSSKWNYEAENFDGIAGLADFVLELYKRKNIELKPSSYLQRYINSARMLPKLRENALNGKRDEDWAIRMYEAYLFKEVGFSLRELQSTYHLDFYLHKLNKGSLNPTDHKPNYAKSHSFELLIASRLHKCGFRIDFVEPDICFHVSDMSFVIACKNLFSEANTQKNLKDARRQIYKSGKRGFIAICIDQMFIGGEILEKITVQETKDYLEKVGASFKAKNEYIMRHQVQRCKHVLGYIISASLPVVAVSDEKGWSSFSLWDVWTYLNDMSLCYPYIEEFRNRLVG
ncbi:MAG: hypothetical protein MUO85_07040 [candidate division Zixibacteria bacterium]|nr:hypothetical protein [candidate division Zixibacteria bacterium]